MSVKNIKNIYKYNYIYGLFDPISGACRYIGVSVRPIDRYKTHLVDKSNTWKCHWIQKLISNGHKPMLFIFKCFDINDDWQSIERAWIKYARDFSFDLTNCTDGGDGILGITGDGYERMKNTWKGRKHKPETIELYRSMRIGKLHTQEWKSDMSITMKGRQITWKDKIAEANKKLKPEQVKEIKELINNKVSQRDIAKMYKVHQGTISNIKRGISYAGIGE